MAKAYKAVTGIEHGEVVDGENQTKSFKPGDVVRGLPKEVMKKLWDEGALEQVDVVEVERASDESKEDRSDGAAAGSGSGSGTEGTGGERVQEPTG